MEAAVETNSNNNPSLHPGFKKLGGVGTIAATPSSISFENIKFNLKTEYTRLHQLPEFKKIKENLPIALVGGGPSVRHQVEEIKKFRTIIACGSSHDWLLTQGIIPTYSTICDPDPISINYLRLKHLEVKYLIASACDPKIFEYLKDCPIVLWHCHSDDYVGKIEELDPGYQAIGGGCTIGLRSVSIAVTLGYKNIHFFGFDSCLSDKESYAYNLSTQEEKDSQGEAYQLKLGMDWDGPGDKIYSCLGYHLAQAEHFRRFLIDYPNLIDPTFHGEGLLPDMVRLLKDESIKLQLKAKLDEKLKETQ